MRQQDQHKPENEASLTVWAPALVALGILVTGFIGTLMVIELDAFRPKVGDMVVFQPNTTDQDV